MEMVKANRSENLFDQFMASKEDGSFYVGHAAVLARLDGKLFLIDGIYPRPLFLDSWLFYPDLVLDKRLMAVDGVFISHCHEDHYDPKFLRDLKPGTPIHITEGRVGFEEILADKNLNVVQVPPQKLHKIASGLEVYSIPSDHNNFDSSFILKGKNFSVFQGNDNFLPDASLVQARKAVGKVNHAYIPFSYVWWYPFCLTSMTDESRRAEITRLTQNNMNIGARMGEIFDSELVVPSAGNLIFYEGANSKINREIATPFDFMDYVQDYHPQIAPRCLPLLAGDYAIQKGGKCHVVTYGVDKTQYFAGMEAFLAKVKDETKAQPSLELNQSLLTRFGQKIRGKDLKEVDLDLYFYPADKRQKSLYVSMRNYSVDIVETPEAKPKSLKFSINPEAFNKWMNGEITLETVLNSQRFLVHRTPEEFNREAWDVLRTHF